MNGTDKNRPLGAKVSDRIHALPLGLENRLLGFIAGELAGTGVATAQTIAGYLDKLEAQQVAVAVQFKPGDRVTDRGNGRLGIVADDPAMTTKYPGYFPVLWDGGTRSVAHPSILAPVGPREADGEPWK